MYTNQLFRESTCAKPYCDFMFLFKREVYLAIIINKQIFFSDVIISASFHRFWGCPTWQSEHHSPGAGGGQNRPLCWNGHLQGQGPAVNCTKPKRKGPQNSHHLQRKAVPPPCAPLTPPGQKPAHDTRLGFRSCLMGKCQPFAEDGQEEARNLVLSLELGLPASPPITLGISGNW